MKTANTVYDAIAHANTSPLYGIHVTTLTSPMQGKHNAIAPKASKCLEVDFADCQTIKIPLRFVNAANKAVVEETSEADAIEAILLGANVPHHLISKVDTSIMIV